MTNMKALLTAGLLVAASAVSAQVTAELKAAAAPTGGVIDVQVIVHPNGTKLNAAGITVEVDVPDVDNIDAVTPYSGTAPAGWDTPVMNQLIRPNGRKWIIFVTVTGDPTDADPLVFSFKIKQNATGFKATKLRLVPYDRGVGTSFSDDEYNDVLVPETSTTIANGKARSLNGVMNNAVAVNGPSISAAAGASLYLLNAADAGLAPVAGWETPKPLDAPVSGRPAFGTIDGAPALAVGTDAGSLFVFTEAGAAAGQYKGDFTELPTAPAIGADNNVYVAGKTAAGVSVARVKVTGGTAALGESLAVAEASEVNSSPAVAQNALVVGTNNSVFYAKVDPGTGVLTPQAVAGTAGVSFNTSPVVSGPFAYVGDATGKVYKVALATGVVEGSSDALPAPLSSPFAMGNKVHFGAGDGKVYTFTGGNLAAATTTDVGSSPVVSPVDNGTILVAATQDGKIIAGPNATDLGPGVGKAVAIIPATGEVVVSKTNGDVFVMPTS